MIASLLIPGASLVGNAPGVYASQSSFHTAGCVVRVVQSDFSVPELGEYGNRYELFLDGDLAFCLLRGAPAKSNVTYSSMTYGTSYAINQALEYFYAVNSDRETYVLCQVYIWAILENKDPLTAMVQAAESIKSDYRGQERDILNTIQNITPNQYYNVFESPTPGEQPIAFMLGNYMESPQYSDVEKSAIISKDLTVDINIEKKDKDTMNALEGAVFEVYVDDIKLGVCETNEEGIASISYTETISAEAVATSTYCSNYDELPYSRLSWVTAFTNIDDATKDAVKKAEDQASIKAKEKLDNTSHTYRAVEITSREGYYLPANENDESFVLDGSGTVSFSFENETILGSIQLVKTELGNDTNLLEGAKYGLYAKEDIIHPDGKTGIVYKKDELVQEGITDSKGEIQFANLILGNYYLKEISAPEGFEISDEETAIGLLTESFEEKNVTKNITVSDKRIPEIIIEQSTDAYEPPEFVETGDVISNQARNYVLLLLLSLLIGIMCVRKKKME